MTVVTAPFDVLIAAGGASRRMGVDKAAIVVNGEALLTRAVGAATRAGARSVVVVGGTAVSSGISARCIADSNPGSGPLAALIDGLRALGDDDPRNVLGDKEPGDGVAVFVAVDHPDLEAAEIVALARRLQSLPGRVVAVVPEVDGRSQPLHSAYRIALAGPLSDLFAAGERSLWGALATFEVDRPDRSSESARASYRDLDDPQQLAHYLAERTDQTDRREHRSVADDDA